MNKLFRQGCGLILVLAMVLTLLPAGVLAAGGSEPTITLHHPDGDSVQTTVYKTWDEAYAAAVDGDTLVFSPGEFGGNMMIGDKSLTLQAEYLAAMPNYDPSAGKPAEDASQLTKITGTFNTYSEDGLHADQNLIIKGFAFSGDGLKIGNEKSNGVGYLEIRYCTMECGENLSSADANSYAGINRFVKVDSEGGEPYTDIYMEENIITGTPAEDAGPIVLRDVNIVKIYNTTCKFDNVDGSLDFPELKAIDIAKMSKGAYVDIGGGYIGTVQDGIYISTELVSGDETGNTSFYGTINLGPNYFPYVDRPIFIGCEGLEGVTYGELGGGISYHDNHMTKWDDVSSGEIPEDVPVEPIIQFKDGKEHTPFVATFKDEGFDDRTVYGYTVDGYIDLWIILPYNENYKENATFEGWRCGDTVYPADEAFLLAEDTTFTAQWTCREHDLVVDAAAVPPTCTKPGLTEASHCRNCDYRVEQDEVPALGHDWDDGIVTQEPTATTDGVRTFTCQRCKITRTESIPATGEPSWENPFADVQEDDWYYRAVEYVAQNSLMAGTSADKFSPNSALDRSMMVTILYRHEGKPAVDGPSSFTDVPTGQWYTDAISWAEDNKIVAGVTETTFAPFQPVTREQMAAIFFRYANFNHEDTSARGDLSTFSDASLVSSYAKTAIQWCVAEGILSGSNGKLNPRSSATRAEFASILMRYIKNVEG